MDLCFLDLETTGFEPKDDSIIEVSLVRYKDGVKIAEYDQVMQTDKSELSDFVTHLTGITQEELDTSGLKITDELAKIQACIGDSIIVGHNIDFDIRFLIGNGIDISQNARIDTHELARILLPLEASFALEVLSEKYGFVHENAHRAMSDVLASKALYELLLEKIEQLPVKYLKEVRPFLAKFPDWKAGELFKDTKGQTNSNFYQKANFYNEPKLLEAKADLPQLPDFEAHQTYTVQAGENKPTADALISLAQNISANGQKVLLVSPKLDYFEALPMCPTPSVLLDPERLQLYGQRTDLDTLEITFYCQCLLRQHMGFRGVFYFDLFFKMRGYWQSVCMTDPSSEKFQHILNEKAQSPILALSPQALFQFIAEPVFADRVLIIDEAEITAEKLLYAPVQKCALGSLIEDSDPKKSQAAQFLMGHFAREIIEPKLGHAVGPFGVKHKLSPRETLPNFTENLDILVPEASLEFWTNWCVQPPEKSTRWVDYHPDRGQLDWFIWQPEAWQTLQKKLNNFPKIYLHRYPFREEENAFWRILFGFTERQNLELNIPAINANLEIPADLISHKSPDYNDYTAQKLAEIFQNLEGNLAANFTSIETMRGVFDTLNKGCADIPNHFLIGEKITGGNGKLREKLRQHHDKKTLLMTQRMMHPELHEFAVEQLVVQKFPFAGPHPLLETMETVCSQGGQSWWDIWVVPQLVASLHQRVGNFKELKRVTFLDPRQNSGWGKKVLSKIFNT